MTRAYNRYNGKITSQSPGLTKLGSYTVPSQISMLNADKNKRGPAITSHMNSIISRENQVLQLKIAHMAGISAVPMHYDKYTKRTLARQYQGVLVCKEGSGYGK